MTRQKSEFWIKNTGVTPEEMEKYKVKERILRLQEELNLLDKEIENIQAKKDELIQFSNAYRSLE